MEKPTIVNAKLELVAAQSPGEIIGQVDLALLICRLLPLRKFSGALNQ
jgi:hypothetical protein